MHPLPQRTETGFSRIDLLAVLATAGTLALLVGPAMGSPNPSRNLICLENLRRLSAAWLMYADDFSGNVVANYAGGDAQAALRTDGWAMGWLDWTTAPANTNEQYLTTSRYSALAAYGTTDLSLFKCPADTFVSTVQARSRWGARVRSYSMNYSMGRDATKETLYPQQRAFRKLADLRELAPAQACVFIEEHPDSLNDPAFAFDAVASLWVDLPSSLHDGTAPLSFADGHAEVHAWVSATTLQPVRLTTFNSVAVPASDPDRNWLRVRCTERR